MRKTRLMSKLFSDETPMEYKEKIQSKMEEAHENGSATLDEDGEKLQFADVEGDIIVEDQTDGMNEVTRISQNPDNENDFLMSEVEVPEEEVTEEVTEELPDNEEVVEETVTESDNLESIEIKRLPGIDGPAADDIVDDLEIEVQTGIEDKEKSGTAVYSMRFKNFSQKKAQLFAKVFSECSECFDKVVESANVDEDVQVKFEGDKMKVMSVTFGKPIRTFSFSEEEEEVAEETTDLTEVIEDANKLAELAEGGVTKENADEIKQLAEEVISKAEAVESDEVSLKSIKCMCSMFSEEAAKVADESEEEKEEVTEEEVKEESETEEGVTEEVTEENPEEEVTEEEVKEECDKSFSDPKVTVTIENLEPASVSDLLGPKEEPAEEEKEDELTPKVNPNDSFSGRSFSMTKDNKTYDNPLLKTDIY